MDVLLFYESTISYWKMLAVQSMSSLMGARFTQILLQYTVTFFPRKSGCCGSFFLVFCSCLSACSCSFVRSSLRNILVPASVALFTITALFSFAFWKMTFSKNLWWLLTEVSSGLICAWISCVASSVIGGWFVTWSSCSERGMLLNTDSFLSSVTLAVRLSSYLFSEVLNLFFNGGFEGWHCWFNSLF